MSNEGNRIKAQLLSQSFGAASNRLRKTILFSMLYGKVYDRNCFQCGQEIEDVDDLSIEHKEPWQSAPDPKAAFFDLENIAFSHLRCNTRGNSYRPATECPNGHPYTFENTGHDECGRRACKSCNRARKQRWHDKQRV